MRTSSQEQDALRATCRAVLDDLAGPERLRAVTATSVKFDAALWSRIVDLGWTAFCVPEYLGGLAGSIPDQAVVIEECGRALQPGIIATTFAAAATIAGHGTAEARELLLPGVADGQVRMTVPVACTRPEALPVLTAWGRGYRMSGRSTWLPDIGAATHAVVLATHVGAVALVVVDLTAPGVEVDLRTSLDLSRLHADVTLNDVELGAEAVISLDPRAANHLFNAGVVFQCAESLGVMSRLLDMTVAHVCQRRQFDAVIGSFQAVKHRLADMLIEREASSATLKEAADMLQHRPADCVEAVSVAKSVCGAAASWVASEALQLHGGIGFTWEHDLHLLLRRAKANELLLGSPAWHQERLVRLALGGNAPGLVSA